MRDQQKNEIKGLLKEYCDLYSSQAKAAASLRGVSEATIINIRTGKWDSISDDMWRNVGKQVGYSKKGRWNFVDTIAAKSLIHYFNDAKEYSNTLSIIAPSGSGKSFVADYYEGTNENVFHVTCAEYFNRKVFLQKLLATMGKENTGYNVAEMMDLIVDMLMKMESPLIILNEVDKLPDPVLYFFITIYNQLEDKCGIVMLATNHFTKRIERGIRINKKGYSEIFSRMGRRFLGLKGVSEEEVTEICRANGLKDASEIKQIWNECEGDLRRVKRGVHKVKMKTKSLRKAA